MKILSIIIVHWNTPIILKKQLINLGQHIDIEIVVVDNNSNEKLDWIRQEFNDVLLIENEINYGYAFACNQGAAKAHGEWLLFLNPDVEITTEAINAFIRQTEDNRYVASSPNPRSDSYQKPLPSLWSFLIEFTPLHRVVPLSPFKKKTLFGGCLLIRKDILEKIGGWDERFFLWFEDSDLTRRLIQNSYRVGWIDVPIKHTGGETFKLLDIQVKRKIFFHSLKLYVQKHFPLLQQFVTHIIIRRFSQNKLLPDLDDSICLVVPNVKKNLLDDFLKNNEIYQKSNIQVIIVTSALNTREFLTYKRKYPTIRFIRIDKNKGFASTVNVGLKACTGKWIGTVNDDTEAHEDWSTICTERAPRQTGSINPVIRSTNGDIESVGIRVLAKGKAEPIIEYDSDKKFVHVDATNGAAVIYKKVALEKVGLFDERFGSYLEDIDLSLRLSRGGFGNYVITQTSLIHMKHQTSNTVFTWQKQYLDLKNWILVILKNWSFGQLVYNLPAIAGERLRNISGLVKSIFI